MFIPKSHLLPAPRRPSHFYQPLVDALKKVLAPSIRSGGALNPVYELPQMRPEARLISPQSTQAPRKEAEPQAKGKPAGGGAKSGLTGPKKNDAKAAVKHSAKAQGSPLPLKPHPHQDEDDEEELGLKTAFFTNTSHQQSVRDALRRVRGAFSEARAALCTAMTSEPEAPESMVISGSAFGHHPKPS